MRCPKCGKFARVKKAMTEKLKLELKWRKVFAKCKGVNDG